MPKTRGNRMNEPTFVINREGTTFSVRKETENVTLRIPYTGLAAAKRGERDVRVPPSAVEIASQMGNILAGEILRSLLLGAVSSIEDPPDTWSIRWKSSNPGEVALESPLFLYPLGLSSDDANSLKELAEQLTEMLFNASTL
jgi:hypothetical protein